MNTATLNADRICLDESIRCFVPRPRFDRVLEIYGKQILELKVRGASYAQIRDLLKTHNIIISKHSIGRFCRQNRHEVQRLSLMCEREGELPPITPGATKHDPSEPQSISTPVTLNPLARRFRKPRDLRGEV